MLFFRSEDHARQWQRERDVPAGEVMSLETLWELSKLWYWKRLEHAYHGRSLEDAQELFRKVGLTAQFWYL